MGTTTYGVFDRVFITARRVLDRVPHTPVRLAWFYIVEFDRIPVLPAAVGSLGFKVSAIDAGDIPALLACRSQSAGMLHRRFDRGDRCVIVGMGDRVVGYEWISFWPVHVEDRYKFDIPVGDTALYLYDCYIVPEFRAKGAWLALRAYVATVMKSFARSRIVSIIDVGNDFSLRTHLRFGYKIDSCIRGFRLFGRTVMMNSAAMKSTSTLRPVRHTRSSSPEGV